MKFQNLKSTERAIQTNILQLNIEAVIIYIYIYKFVSA